ncbi:MAG: hypothetical protein KDB52_04245 [Solirubrobacterales bacterium]|nr:hypothetical protein [Solirubrobacterales bacterium]
MSLGRGFSTLLGSFVCAIAILAGGSTASAELVDTEELGDGVQRLTYRIGPIDVTTGQNRIVYKLITAQERPPVDGYITAFRPNLVNPDGTIPKSSSIMFHHGVWINLSRRDATSGRMSERFIGTGEEKTEVVFPPGFGYFHDGGDTWLLNHMIHNLTPAEHTLYITYQIDFVPETSPAAEGMRGVRPIWMDVVNPNPYPVFDTYKGSGGKDGKIVWPYEAKEDPYKDGIKRNLWTVDRDGVMVWSVGHVHTGGLATDLYLNRDGAKYEGPKCPKPKILTSLTTRKLRAMPKAKRKAKAKSRRKAAARYRKCRAKMPDVKGERVHLFTSQANYYEPAGPVSWDMAMRNTRPDWLVGVKAGDTLEVTTTYETKRASWYENMGIHIGYMADGDGGKNPYKTRVDYLGPVNHPHYPENNDHGGKLPTVGPDPTLLPNGPMVSNPFTISDYSFGQGDFRLPGSLANPAVVEKGETFTFGLSESDIEKEVWHSLTSCKAPCNKSTGIAYPIADGSFRFDSGQLGVGGAPTVERTTWTTPANLPVGTHTFFCRIHPLMRGAIRVVPKNGG